MYQQIYLSYQMYVRQQKYQLHQEQYFMTSSTESKLKSKYDSSSKKIQQLYEQFSMMRRNICTPSKRRNQDSFIQSGQKFQQASLKNSIQVSIPRNPKTRQHVKSEVINYLSFQNQSFMRNALLKNLTVCFMQMDKKLDQRQALIQIRLENVRNLFCQVSKIYKLKIKNNKIQKTPPCKCCQLPNLIKQVESRYDKKIASMVNSYENKISLLVKEHQQTSDSSNSKKITKQIKDQIQKVQDQLVVKQQQITTLKIQSSKLRRALDQQKLLVIQKQSLIQQLTLQIADKQKKLSEISKFKIQKIASQDKQCDQCQKLQKKLLQCDNQNIKLSDQNKKFKKQIQELIKNKKQSCNSNNNNGDFMPEQNLNRQRKRSWNFSSIDVQDQVISDCQPQKDMMSGLKVQNIDECQPLRHTQYFNSNSKKGSVRHEQRIKELEAELQLVNQQNKLLKNKKDKFQDQCKQNESDEQKFQMQCQILRDQLKNLNTNLKILDQCAILCLKDKKIPEQNVDKLAPTIKFREQFFKKHPRKRIQKKFSQKS